MKSLIALLLTGLVSVSVYATPIQLETDNLLDAGFGMPVVDIVPALDTGFELPGGWDNTLSVTSAVALDPGAGIFVFQNLWSVSKYCHSGPMNAWGFGGGCYAADEQPQSVPEPGTLVLLGMGLFLLALAQRRRRDQATAGW